MIAWNSPLPHHVLPCMLADIVAFDNEQVAGKVMYILTDEDWKRYQLDISSRAIDIMENEVKVKTESEGVLHGTERRN